MCCPFSAAWLIPFTLTRTTLRGSMPVSPAADRQTDHHVCPSSAQLYPRPGVLEVIRRLLKPYLPGKTVYPAVGNHEGVPVNRYSFYMPPSTSPSTAAIMAGSHATGHVCRVCTCGQVMSSWVRTHDYF